MGLHGFDPTYIEKSDEDLAIRDFVFTLYKEFNTTEFSTRMILHIASENDTFIEGVVDDVENKKASYQLGHLLKKLAGQVFTDADTGENLKFVKIEGTQRPVKYAFEIDTAESRIGF